MKAKMAKIIILYVTKKIIILMKKEILWITTIIIKGWGFINIINWFDHIENLMKEVYENYMREAKVVHTIIFVVLQCFLLLYYVIIWRKKFIEIKTVIQKNQEFINLIPEEIKYIMIDKINE